MWGYVYMSIISNQWVAQLSIGFHLVPKTPIDIYNIMFSHQTFILCFISAPYFYKTSDK